jgi:hypothetical protein
VWMGDFSGKLTEVFERIENLGSTRLSDVRGLSERVGRLERARDDEEVTQA